MLKKILIRWALIASILFASIYFILPTYNYYLYKSYSDFSYLADEYEKGLSKKTIARRLASIKSFYRYLINIDYLNDANSQIFDFHR